MACYILKVAAIIHITNFQNQAIFYVRENNIRNFQDQFKKIWIPEKF